MPQQERTENNKTRQRQMGGKALPGNRYIEANFGHCVSSYQVTGLPGRKTTITEQ